ncbi:methyl-accepting chemotaxis protein [Hydrogenophaga sp.]|uniref:methyl-accepting chemotaxis protein n=1 Tax=Hydrogenophaga sp. TaxID=1904254 RepID=UPI003415DD11
MLFFKSLKPGVTLMRNLRLPTKLGALAVVLIVPLVLITVFLVQRLAADIRVTQDEIHGGELVQRINAVIVEVQKHRGQINMLLSGNPAAQDALTGTRDAMNKATGELENSLSLHSRFELLPEWAPLKARVQALSSSSQGTAAQAFALHSELVRDLRQMIYTTAERSSLLFDPVPGTYFLMDMTVSQAPAWAELIGQIRGLGAGQLALAEPDLAVIQSLKVLIGSARSRSQDMAYLQRFLRQHGLSDLNGQATIDEVMTYLEQAERALAQPGSMAAPSYFAAGTRAIDAIAAYDTQLAARLGLLLEERLQNYQWLRTVTLAAASSGILLVTYLMLSFYFSFVTDFRQVIAVMRETATGNLRSIVLVRGSDELAEQASLLKRMNANLSAMVAEVRSSSALVAHSGQGLALGNRDLADRTEQQAANLEQTAASVQELSSTVHQNAGTASDSDAQASQVRDVAESGAQAMNEAVDSVSIIQKGAQQMNDIIGVIDSLAFQTNILALNAAVEAARAGEQGRGFAVVANEVRTLAQRSSAASREIRELIQASSSQVDASVKRIRTAGDNMTKIVSGVRGVATNMSLISAASAEQSTGLIQISSAVSQLDEITQRNAQMVERAVQQANQLATRAGELSRAVSSFQLQQGTAEEAIALVNRAVALRASVGKDTFVADLTTPSNGFHDRDMYVFALDRTGGYRAFGGKPEKVGSRVQDIQGVDGQALLEAIINQAESEPGWVEYDIVNPQTGAVQAKMSYVTRVDDLYVGCGVYKTVLAETA